MTYETYLQEFKTAFDGKDDVGFNHTMKLHFGSEKAIHIDDTGSSCVVSAEDKSANITIQMSEAIWEKMKTKEIGGAQAYIENNITVLGDFRILIYTGTIFKKITT